MIEVSHLTKKFAGCLAVNDLSFTVAAGEIIGLLGPNGAGKSTTLRMLTGYLPATSGAVTVAGFDVQTASLEVRRHIGYLPENVPLYPEMRVDEYLKYRARLKGVPARRLRRRLGEVKDLCGLGEVGGRILGQLSKGFRQRVGLADSLIHEPALLILDEPTIGLDPHQIRQVRELIKALAAHHTILLSSHILPEVELTCQRVLILDRGRLVASDTPETLRARLQGEALVTLEVEAARAAVEPALQALPGVHAVRAEEQPPWTRFTLRCAGGSDPREALFRLAAGHGWPVRELRRDQQSLEDVFVSLTNGTEGGTHRL